MGKNIYIGEYPVTGIRPTIDGRRGALGVRELLEEQTMNMVPRTIMGVWGFSGTERPVASVRATHAQKGLSAFGIYGPLYK